MKMRENIKLFICNLLVYYVDDKWFEFFYSQLKPWVHYIPVSQKMDESQELIEFAIENDKVALDIVRRYCLKKF